MKEIGTGRLVGTFEDGSPEWHAARLEHIGASDVPIILGLSGYKSAYTLWHEKAGLIDPAPVSPEFQRKRDYGHFMEPFVESLWQAAHPELSAYKTGTWRHRERPWQGCNPDRLVMPDGRDIESVLQIKTANFLTDWETEIPPAYVAQVEWELDTFGFKAGTLAVYFNVSGHYREYEIEVDPFRADAVRARVLAFAESITDGNPPEIDGSADTYTTIRRLNPSLKRGAEVEIPSEVAEAYLYAADWSRRAEADLTKWKGHLLAHMGTAQYATYAGKRLASRIAKGDNPPYLQESK